ncbi:MAG TPA: hypothetical protein VL282_11060 [Tepidisphaeraceae bacterium]|nr:hypothetical protein [Tepidisphaeraceae bacterium]
MKLGDRVVHLSGKIKAAVDDKMLRVDVDYSDTAPGNAQSIKSLIMTPIDQPKTIAGMNRGDLTFAVVLTLHEYKPTNE